MYLTVAQTPIFQKYAAAIWTSGELDRLVNWIALNPLAGDVISGSGGLRKVRWSASGRGKRGGARVIYYNLLQDGTVWLLMTSHVHESAFFFLHDDRDSIRPATRTATTPARRTRLIAELQSSERCSAGSTRAWTPSTGRSR